MFTGLIETVGEISGVRRGDRSVTFSVDPRRDDFIVSIGDSVAINGVCLTAVSTHTKCIEFTAISETLARSSLAGLVRGDRVNLERAMLASGRLDGHIVQGHVDGLGRIIGDESAGDGVYRSIEVPSTIIPYMAEKGSVSIDGISLTIARSEGARIAVALIPHTMKSTTMCLRRPGDLVNIECDVLARYIFHILKTGRSSDTPAPVSADLLTLMETNGF